MSFFYDLNKKLDGIRATPEVTHQQLNERDEGKPGKNFAKIAKDAGERYGSKAAGERVAGAVRNKLRDQGKLEEGDMDESAFQAAIGKKKYGEPGMRALQAAGRRGDSEEKKQKIRDKFDRYDDKKDQLDELSPDTLNRYADKAKGQRGHAFGRMQAAQQGNQAADPTGKFAKTWDKRATGYNRAVAKGATDLDKSGTRSTWTYDQDMEEGVMDTVKKVGKKVASGVNKLVGHGSDEEMRKDLQRKSGAPVTGKKPEQRSMRESAGPLDFDKVLDAIAALYGDDIWNNDAMQDLANDLEQAGPTDRELDFIIAKGRLPKRLAGTQFSAGDSVRFGESGAPMTSKQKSFAKLAPPKNKITFADKIAGAKKEVDEMLGDVAAEAMRSALGGGRGRNAEMDENNAFDYKSPRQGSPKVGSVERGHKHDIKHTATGRVVTRRTDDQGHSVGADDEADAGPRGRGRPKGTKNVSSKAKVFQRKSKLMTKESDVDVTDQGEYDQEGDMAKNDIQTIVRHAQALHKVLGDNDNLPEWVQSKLAKIEDMMISVDEYMQNQSDKGDEEPIAEKAVSKQQQKFMGMAHAMQKGEKIKGASKELKKVAKTMKPKDVEDFAATKHKGLPAKVSKKKKEVDENSEEGRLKTTVNSDGTSSTSSTTGRINATIDKGGVTVKPAKSSGMSFGKGIYDSMNRELELMIAESMNINMSDSTEGDKSLTITATDEDALKLGMLLKNAGLGGGDAHGGDMHSHGEEACDTCGMQDCGCGDVQEAVDENAPDWPTNTETSSDALQYAGGLNKPKTDVAGDGQTTVPNTAVHSQDSDLLRRIKEMAGLAEAAKPDFLDMDKDGDKEESMKDAVKDKKEDSVEESIRRMREMAGIQEAKKEVDEADVEEGNLFTKGLEDDNVKIGDKIPGTNAIKKKDIDESIFALTNQWRAYRG